MQALFMAHPGHELLVYGWFKANPPLVMVLTDGAGSSGRPRTAWTRKLVRELGGVVGEPFGRHTDGELYRAILQSDLDLFTGVVDELTAVALQSRIDALISDAVEHYNPVHDICSVMATLAARRALRVGKKIERLDCPIAYAPARNVAWSENLSQELVVEKQLVVADATDLAGEVERLVNVRPGLVEREALIAVNIEGPLLPAPEGVPYYETYGRKQLAKRGGGELITWRDHMAPLVRQLEDRERALAVRAGHGDRLAAG